MHQEAFGDGICLDQLEVYGSPVRLAATRRTCCSQGRARMEKNERKKKKGENMEREKRMKESSAT